MPVTISSLDANGMTFRVRTAGATGEPVILLHGFPETSHMWVPLMERLEAEGYRCLAPDQRGYSPGARPEGKENYRYIDVAGDIRALADAAGFERFHLIGHDWGAGAGWAYVCKWPDRVLSWTAMSVPHIGAFGRAIREDADQQQRSQYINLFVQEGVAEAQLSANDFEVLKGVWSQSSEEERAEYLSVFNEPGALTAALNWYRASNGIDPANMDIDFGDVHTPTLVLWGNNDQAIGRQGCIEGAAYMKGPYKFVEVEAGHWLVQESFDTVSGEIVEHLKAHGAR